MALKLSLAIEQSNPADFSSFGYSTIDVLTPGQFGKTYVVEDDANPGVTYVAKSVDLSMLTEKERENCKLEADLLKILDHPCILKCKETFMHGTALVLILEHCKGGDLQHEFDRRLKAQESFTEKELGVITKKLLEGLDYLHTKNKIIHRDIKPANILILIPGDFESVKIADFGISKMMNKTLQLALTNIGTPAYMSPEMLIGNSGGSGGYTFASDIWALGCVIWELSTGRNMYDAHSIGNLVHIITNRRRKTPKIDRDDLSNDFKNMIYQMLSQSASQRCSPSTYLSKKYFMKNGYLYTKSHVDLVLPLESDGASYVDLDELEGIFESELSADNAANSVFNGNAIASFLRYFVEVMRRGDVLEIFMITAMDKEVENALDWDDNAIIEEEDEEEETMDSDFSENERTIHQTRKIKRALLIGKPNATDCQEVCLNERWDIAWLKRGNCFFQMGLDDSEIHEIAEILRSLDFEHHSGEYLISDLVVLFGKSPNMNIRLIKLWQKMTLFRILNLCGGNIHYQHHTDEDGKPYIVFEHAEVIVEEIVKNIEQLAMVGDVVNRIRPKSAFKSSLVNKIKRPTGQLSSYATTLYYRASKRTKDGDVMLQELETELISFITGTSAYNKHPKSLRSKKIPYGTPRLSKSRPSSTRALKPTTGKNLRTTNGSYTPPVISSPMTAGSPLSNSGPTETQSPFSTEAPTSRRLSPSARGSRRSSVTNGMSFGIPEEMSRSRSGLSAGTTSHDNQMDQAKSYYIPSTQFRRSSQAKKFGSYDGCVEPDDMRSIRGPVYTEPLPSWEHTPTNDYLYQRRSNGSPQAIRYATDLLNAWARFTSLKQNCIIATSELTTLTQDELQHTAKVLHLKHYITKVTSTTDIYAEQELDVEIELIYAIRSRLETQVAKCQNLLHQITEYTMYWDEHEAHYLHMSTPLAIERKAEQPHVYFRFTINSIASFFERYKAFCYSFDSMCCSQEDIPSSLQERKQFTRQFNHDIEKFILWLFDVILSFIPGSPFLSFLKYHIGFQIDENVIIETANTIKTILEINTIASLENSLLTAFISLDNHSIISGRYHLRKRIQAMIDDRRCLVSKLVINSPQMKSYLGFLVALDKRDKNIIDFFNSDRFEKEVPSDPLDASCQWHRNKLLRLSGDWRASRLYYLSDANIVLRNLLDSNYDYIKTLRKQYVQRASVESPWYSTPSARPGIFPPSKPQFSNPYPMHPSHHPGYGHYYGHPIHHSTPIGGPSSARYPPNTYSGVFHPTSSNPQSCDQTMEIRTNPQERSINLTQSSPLTKQSAVRFNASGDPNASPARTYHPFETAISASDQYTGSPSSPGTPGIIADVLPSPKRHTSILKRTKSKGLNRKLNSRRNFSHPPIDRRPHSELHGDDIKEDAVSIIQAHSEEALSPDDYFHESFETPINEFSVRYPLSRSYDGCTPLTTGMSEPLSILTPSPLQYRQHVAFDQHRNITPNGPRHNHPLRSDDDRYRNHHAGSWLMQ